MVGFFSTTTIAQLMNTCNIVMILSPRNFYMMDHKNLENSSFNQDSHDDYVMQEMVSLKEDMGHNVQLDNEILLKRKFDQVELQSVTEDQKLKDSENPKKKSKVSRDHKLVAFVAGVLGANPGSRIGNLDMAMYSRFNGSVVPTSDYIYGTDSQIYIGERSSGRSATSHMDQMGGNMFLKEQYDQIVKLL
ncbi:putative serine carboxypeptidase-like 11-like [Capsicum annuum]|nr:putative serine carboxypeptidase-like 11-like [Capsicum annuum]KAF3646046.1 putative serine carboxypeptidase-like 11-like [Capsicum annuum]